MEEEEGVVIRPENDTERAVGRMVCKYLAEEYRWWEKKPKEENEQPANDGQ